MSDKKRRTSRPIHTEALSPATIAERAYAKWLARGCPVSDGREDWFAAQAELTRESTQRTTSTRRTKRAAVSGNVSALAAE
jgi:hypothetical protein